MDHDLKFVFWNKAAQLLLGYSADEVVGRYCHEVFAGTDACGARICHASCLTFIRGREGKQIPTGELFVRAKGGRPIWISLNTLFVRSKKRRNLSLIIHIFRELSGQGAMKPFLEEATGLLSQEAKPPRADTGTSGDALTPRENQVLQLLASGSTTRAIADRLCISPLTVRNHIRSVLAKLGVHTRLEAVVTALGRHVPASP
jgi:PAS domain S-box-containing protein